MRKRLLSLVVILTLALGITVTSEGFGASVSAGMSGGSCEVGKTATVTLTYSGPQLFAATATLSYDSSALELTGYGGSVTTRNGNSFLLETMGSTSMSATFTFKVKKAGTYAVSASTSAGLTYDSEEFSCSTVSASIKATEPQAAKPSTPSSGSSSSSSSGSSSSSSSGSNTNSGTPNRRGDFTEAEKVEPEEEEEEEEPLEKPEQVEVEIGDKTYIICEDIKEEDAPAGFKLATVKYGEWDWEVPAYADEEGKYVLICLMDKESEKRQFFLYDEEGGTFDDEIPVSVAEFMEYKNLAAAAAEAENEEEEDNNVLVPVLIVCLAAAAAYAAVLQVMMIKKKRKKPDFE